MKTPLKNTIRNACFMGILSLAFAVSVSAANFTYIGAHNGQWMPASTTFNWQYTDNATTAPAGVYPGVDDTFVSFGTLANNQQIQVGGATGTPLASNDGILELGGIKLDSNSYSAGNTMESIVYSGNRSMRVGTVQLDLAAHNHQFTIRGGNTSGNLVHLAVDNLIVNKGMFTVNNGGSFCLQSLSIGQITMKSGTVNLAVSKELGTAGTPYQTDAGSDYSIGKINFSMTGNKIIWLANYNANVTMSNNVTSTGIQSAAGTENAFISAASVSSATGGAGGTRIIHTPNLIINVATDSERYASNVRLGDSIGYTSATDVVADSGTTSGILTVTKTGAGTQIFTGDNNSYTGGTNIKAGVMGISGSSGFLLGKGDVTVFNGGTLAGMAVTVAENIGGSTTGAAYLDLGNAANKLEVQSSGTLLTSDNKAGTFTVANAAVTFAAGANLNFTADAAGNASQLILDATASITSGAITVSLLDESGGLLVFDTTKKYTYALIDASAAGSVSLNEGTWTLANTVAGGYQIDSMGFSLHEGILTLEVDVSAIPEPSTYAAILGALSLVTLALRRRVRR